MQILTNIPLWVFPLFAGLLALGLMARRDRSTPVAIYFGLPFLGFLSLRAVMILDPPLYVWTLFIVGYAAGTAFGFRAQQDYIVRLCERRVHLTGEDLTLTTLMTIFALNFAKGTATAIAPQIVTTPAFLSSFALIASLIAGIFLGRSLAVIRTAHMRDGASIVSTA